MIDVTSEEYQKDYKTLLKELNSYSEILSEKKKILAFTKADLVDQPTLKKVMKRKIRGYSGPVLVFSAATNFQILELIDELWNQLKD